MTATILPSCRHSFCKMYGLQTTGEYPTDLCVSVLDPTGKVVDVYMLDFIYRTEGYLNALEAFTDMLLKPVRAFLPTTVQIFRGNRQAPLMIEAEKVKRDEWRKMGAFGVGSE